MRARGIGRRDNRDTGELGADDGSDLDSCPVSSTGQAVRRNDERVLMPGTHDLATGCDHGEAHGGPRSIVLFMVDQLAARWVEACLAGAAPLPNIARLQARGTTFRHAISSNPICSPARASIATGLTTRHHGMLLNGYNLDPSIPTFMQALQAAGWRTGAFGKLHLRSQYESLFPDYRPYGFDVQDITEDARGGPWLEWIRTTHPEHLDAALSTVWGRSFPGFKCHGPEGVDLAARFPSTPELYGAYELPFPEEISQTNWTTERAVDFIRATDRDQSIFAHVSYVQPHDPYAPPPGYLDRVDAGRLPEPLPAEWADDPCTPPIFHDMGGRATPAPEWRRDRRHYFADLCHLDRQLGVLETALAESGRLDDTVIIFLSDHGDLLHDHGLKLKGGLHYDACVRVPLVIAGPGLQQGRERSELVQLEDICPTIHELAGVEVPQPQFFRTSRPGGGLSPDRVFDTLPGRSLAPLCRGTRAADWRDAAYAESFSSNTVPHTPDRWARTVRTHDWRYTMYPEGGGEQLFDLKHDPDEQRNLVHDPAYDGTRRDLRDRLLELLIVQDYPHSPRGRFAYGVP